MVSSDHGLFKKAGKQFIYKPISKNRNINRSLRKIFKGNDGSIYFGSHSSGLIKIKNDSITFYQCPYGHCDNNVYSFYEDSRGNKWVGTLYGLHKIENGNIIKIGIEQIKIDRPVYLIFEDNNNNLWIGSDNGVYKLDGEEVDHYTVNDGLSGQETNRDAGLVDSYGNVWIGTNNGATLYREEFEIDEEKTPPLKIFIEYLIVNSDTLPLKNKIKLPYAANNLTFHFTAISYINENKIFYKCKLEGSDKHWSAEFRSPNNQYRYNSVPPGNYKFCVKAKNAFAVKFTFRDGRIIIATRTNNDKVEVCIKDNGKGMDKETMSGLFEIQEKANSKGTDDEPGTGLGLILCKDFIERNSGKIWAESDNGNGSMFCFSLPQAEKSNE